MKNGRLMMVRNPIRAIGIVICLVLLLLSSGMAPAQATGPINITVVDTEAMPGDIVDVELRLNTAPGVNRLQFSLEYDPNVLVPVIVPHPVFVFPVVSVTPGNIMGKPVFPPPPAQGSSSFSMTFETIHMANATSAGVLATVHFRVLETASPGTTTTITLRDGVASSAGQNQNVAVNSATGRISVGGTVATQALTFNPQGGTWTALLSGVTRTGNMMVHVFRHWDYGQAIWDVATSVVTISGSYRISRAGYAFAGWWTAPSGGIRIIESTPVSEAAARTLYARWVPEGVSTWDGLRTAINAAPANVPTTIHISSSFAAPAGAVGAEIVIPANRDITLVSTNTAPGITNVRTLTQTQTIDRMGQRHFQVDGSLTLCQNITLSGGVPNNTNQAGGVRVRRGGTLTMNSGSVIENCHWPNGSGGAIWLFDAFPASNIRFNMSGGIIRNNSANWGGGVAAGATAVVTISDGLITGNVATSGGGGISQFGSTTVHITGGAITGNTSAGAGGGVHVWATAANAFMMTGGYITNNSAGTDGGGIFTSQYSTALTIPETAYQNLNIGTGVVFYGNTAGTGASEPPNNRLAHIATVTASVFDYVLNNYDINYTGRLGGETPPVVDSWDSLRAAINAAPGNEPHTIQISDSFAAPAGTAGNAIVIPADRYITLVSDNTAPGGGNVRTLTQTRDRRLFHVDGSLTLCQNITLNGGVLVQANGTLTINAGSVIENGHAHEMGGAVALVASGAHLHLSGGIIRNSIARYGGGIFGCYGTTITMSDGLITGNEALHYGGGIVQWGTFIMTGGTISDNTASERRQPASGGGIAHVGGTLHISGGSITGNGAYADGGGIFIDLSNITSYHIGANVVLSDNWPEDIFYGYGMWWGFAMTHLTQGRFHVSLS